MGNAKAQVQKNAVQDSAGAQTSQEVQTPESTHHTGLSYAARKSDSVNSENTPNPVRVGRRLSNPLQCQHMVKRAQLSIAIQRHLGNARLGKMLAAGPQLKIPMGPPGDKYEQEADQVAERVVSDQPVARISRIGRSSAPSAIFRQTNGEEQLPNQSTPIQPLPVEHEEQPMASTLPQGLEEGAAQLNPIQRVEPEQEQPTQALPIQRMGEEEERVDSAPMQRQEEEDLVQGGSLQRLGEDKEAPMMSMQRQEEELPTQMLAMSRQSASVRMVQALKHKENCSCPTCSAQRKAVKSESDETQHNEIQDEGLISRLRSPGGGRAMPATVQRKMENSMGADFSQVRLHDSAQDQNDANQLGAKAFAYGNHVWLGKGTSESDQKLMAHELTHVVQQGAVVQRLRKESDNNTDGVNPGQFMEKGWNAVNELGVVYKEGSLAEGGGANIRETPGGKILSWLPQNTKIFILKYHPQQNVYAVTVSGSKNSRFGYIAASHVWRNLPDPNSDVLKINSGETPIDIARKHYAKKGFNVWSKDQRYVVNALVWVNNNTKHNTSNAPGIIKPGSVKNAWFTAKSTAGVYIWLPGAEYLNAIYEQVAKHGGGTGSISGDLWRGVKKVYEFAAFGLAFIGGLVHGFVKSIYDLLVNTAKLVINVLVSIFTGEVLNDAAKLWEAIKKITLDDIKKVIGQWGEKWKKKLSSNSPWVAGHAHGYLIGYLLGEIAQLLVTGGTIAALKGVVWASRLGRIIKQSAAVRKLASASGKVRKIANKSGKAIKATKVFTTLNSARKWVSSALLLSANTVKGLSLSSINLLRSLPESALSRLRKFSHPLKRTILGCASPCKVDIDVVQQYLSTLSAKVINKSKKLNTIEDVLAALPAGVNKTTIKAKLKKHKPLMEAIKKAGITDADLTVVGKFLTAADKTNAATAYRTFVRTLTVLVPAKIGPDIRKFNKIAESLVSAGPKIGAALKGSMFETFAKLHLGRFRNYRFDRVTFKRGNGLAKRRTSDGYIESSKILWDFKHFASKVPEGQALDYKKIVDLGLKSTDGKTVKKIYYLFPSEEVAQLNKHLLKFDFGVYFVTPPDIVSKLK